MEFVNNDMKTEDLHHWYNATSTEKENGELETYQEWLERQVVHKQNLLDDKQRELEQLTNKAKEGYMVGYNRAMTKYGICENDREMRDQKDWEKELEI